MMWYRHTGDSLFHQGPIDGGSRATFCRGRWPVADELHGEVEHNASPPHDERCDACERARIERCRIERGLDELVAATAPVRVIEWPFDFSDVEIGGEA